MNKKYIRLNEITAYLNINNAATIKDLAEKFDVSLMTIRRDLEQLEKMNVVKLIHGGVIFNPVDTSSNKNYSLPNAESQKIEEKIRIGKKASALLTLNDILIIDTGSTTEYAAQFIPNEMPLTILCYALNILTRITKKQNCRLIFGGGLYHENSLMFESPEGLSIIKRNRATKAFISASGINDKLGVTCSNHYESATKQAIMESSQIKFLLVDSSKFGKVNSDYFAEIDDFDVIITDHGIPEEYLSLIKEKGVQYYIV